MIKAIKAALRTIIVIVCLLLLSYNIYVLVARYAFGDEAPSIFGYTSAAVASWSMDDGDGDDIKKGDLVIVRAQDNYAEGDIIMFRSGNEFVTHRIIEVSPYGYITKGDANDAADFDSVVHSAVKGKVVAVLGGAGNFVEFVRTPVGIITIIAFGAALWIVTGLIASLAEKKADKNKDED